MSDSVKWIYLQYLGVLKKNIDIIKQLGNPLLYKIYNGKQRFSYVGSGSFEFDLDMDIFMNIEFCDGPRT